MTITLRGPEAFVVLQAHWDVDRGVDCLPVVLVRLHLGGWRLLLELNR